MAIDEARMGEFMGRMAGYMTGGALCFGVWLGDELGLYRSLAAGPKTADDVAGATGCHPGWCGNGLTAKSPAGWSNSTRRRPATRSPPKPSPRWPTTVPPCSSPGE